MNRFVCTASRTVVLLMLLPLVATGCARKIYRAAKLPAEFAAPAALNMETFNLSGLADQSISAQVIQPGDVLDVTMVTDYTKLTTTTTPLRVGDDGGVVVPLVGKVGVLGLTVEQAEQVIAGESVARGVFRTPCVTVTMKQCRTNRVTVVGAVNKPGTHELPRGSTSLLTALVAAEGLSKEASSDIEIRRTDMRAQPLNGPTAPPARVADGTGAEGSLMAYQAANGPAVMTVSLAAAAAGKQKPPELRDGDVVYVAKRTLPPIHVLGLVCKPGEYEFPASQELRVLDALSLAGGCSNPVAEKVLVIRHLPNHKEPVQISVGVQAAKGGPDNIALAPGDTVMVEQTPETVAVDIFRNFFRFSVGSSIPF